MRKWIGVICLGLVILLPEFLGTAKPPVDVFVFGSTVEAETLDPHDTIDNFAWRAIYYCYDRLVKFVGETTEVEPALATSWEVSEDGRTYVFHLRKGVNFIDGTPFDAYAVAYSFKRLISLKKPAYGTIEGILDIDGIEVVDDFTIKFTLNFPFVPFLASLATNQLSIVSPGVQKYDVGDYAAAWLAERSAGTGPFYVKEWRRGEVIVLARNENYWGKKPFFREVHIRYIPEAAVLRELLEKGEVDMAEVLTDEQLDALAKVPGIRIFEAPSFSVSRLYMNCTKPYLSDRRVRQAISFAIDYDAIIYGVTKGHAVQMRGPIPIGMWGHDPTVFQYKRDVERARQLLAEAGYSGGFKLTMLIDPGIQAWVDTAAIVQANLAEIGITVEIIGYARPTMRAMINRGEHELSIGFWTPDYPDPDMFAWYWFYSGNHGLAGNRSFYTNPRMDELAVGQRAEPDPAKRLEMLKELQRIAVEDAVYVYLYQRTYRTAMREWVKGYVYNPMLLYMPNFDTMYKDYGA
jgi:peptide/nickel transport system substrate-binding protein